MQEAIVRPEILHDSHLPGPDGSEEHRDVHEKDCMIMILIHHECFALPSNSL